MEEWPKIRQKYLCTVTLIAQPPQRLHSLPRWNRKYDGHIFLKIHFSGEAHFLLLIEMEVKILVMLHVLTAGTQKGPKISG